MVARISVPGKPTRLVDLGPANGSTRPVGWVQRLTIDEQLALHKRKR